ncbi:hypothetical protein [Catelliglobosispora koreensis]|uniref:hypothetical protein n=1 Tax=Catelliglobosispora koreensis TaxID=129052 RepID=UPI00035CC9F1|nr:hypothetical protein [Catelliglobosispora koreensis]
MITASLVPAFDSAKLIRTLYRFDFRRLATLTGLTPAASVTDLQQYPGAVNGLTPLANNGFHRVAEPGSIVVGGGCLGYSNADLAQLRVDYLTDTMLALAFAAWARLPCLIYLPIGEEMITAEPGQHASWSQFGDRIELVVRGLAAQFDTGQHIHILRTDTSHVRALLDERGSQLAEALPASAIGSLYALRPSGKAVSPSEARLTQYRSTIATYLPDVIRQLLGQQTIRRVIAAENLHQVKAIAQARQLAGASGDSIDHLAHVPAPSLGGTTRMATAAADNVILACADPATSAAAVHRANQTVQTYWHAVWSTHRSLTTADHSPTLTNFFASYRSLLSQEGTL